MNDDENNIYKCQSAVDLQFFLEDVYAGQYAGEREKFLEHCNVYMKRYADRVCEITAKNVREEILKTYEKKIGDILSDIQEENVINSLSKIIKDDGEDREEGDLFSLDKIS